MMSSSFFRAIPAAVALAALTAGGVLLAQDDGGVRTNAPLDASGSFEIGGIDVDVNAKDAEAARQAGWRLAQRLGWQKLSQRLTGSARSASDATLNSVVSGIIVENEQIGPHRYVARLGVMYNRARAAGLLGVAAGMTRSPPMLLLPLQISGGTATMFERKTPWAEAWARFRTGNSLIDYVRPIGTGADSLLLNAGQAERRGRGWWRTILDQYGARDVLIPEVRLFRRWPGGPVVGVFTARHGPDNRKIASFTLRVARADAIDALLDAGIARIDKAYEDALRSGALGTDPLLGGVPELQPTPEESEAPVEEMPVESAGEATIPTTIATVQYDSPGAAAVASAEASLRGVPGVSSAITSSLALGGVSVMRVSFAGDLASLRAALEARGWQVSEGAGNTLRIQRAAQSRPQPLTPSPTVGNSTGE